MRRRGEDDRVIRALWAAPDLVRSLPLDCLGVSVRTLNCLKTRGLKNVEELFYCSDQELLRIDGFGLKCLHDLEKAVRDISARYPTFAPTSFDTEIEGSREQGEGPTAAPPEVRAPIDQPLAEILCDWLVSLDERSAVVMRSRLGLTEKSKTLEEIGTEFGITRERVRQIQKKAVGRLFRVEGLADKLIRTILNLLVDRTAPFYLAGAPAEHVWFSSMQWPEQMLSMLLDWSTKDLHVFDLYGRPIASRILEDDWLERIRLSKAFLIESVASRITISEARRAIDAIAGVDASELSEELWRHASEQAHFTEEREGDGRLVAYGRSAEDLVRAVLESSESPLHYRDINEAVETRFGREESRRIHQAAASVGLLLGRGVYGMRHHIPLSKQEEEFVRDLCEDVVREGPPTRQWHARELLAEVEEVGGIDNKLDRYSLSALLHRSDYLIYVGRFIWVARPEIQRRSSVRLNLNNAIEALLEEEGAPLTRAIISERLSAIRGLGATFQIHPKGRLFRAAQNMWGLLDRDFPADVSLLATWLDRLEGHLKSSLRAVHVSEISALLEVDGSLAWPILGAAQLDPRFRVATGDLLCIEEWAGTNRATMHDAVQRLVPLLIQGTRLDLLMAEAERVLQRPVSYDVLRAALRVNGARYDVTQQIWVRDVESDDEAEEDELSDLLTAED